LDKQDFLAAVSGPRGSGKSYTCLSALNHVADEVADIRGGDPLDYFDPRHNVLALDDAQSVSELLARKSNNKHQCILIDDNVALGNHDWNTKASKNAVKIFMTMRTMRNCIFLNAPLFQHLDNSIRDYCQMTMWIAGSFHVGGFNIVKVNYHEVSQTGKDYKHRLSFDGKKIDYWASFAPPQHILDYYDVAREESAKRLAELISETGSATRERDYTGNKKSAAEKNLERAMEKHEDTIVKMFEENPYTSLRQISSKICVSPIVASRIVDRLGLELKIKRKGEP
jgi:ABC-type dipeptide/oligopeptide/nickel transport system ATPase component